MAAIVLTRSVSMAAVQQYRSVKTILPRTPQHVSRATALPPAEPCEAASECNNCVAQWVGDGFHVHPVRPHPLQDCAIFSHSSQPTPPPKQVLGRHAFTADVSPFLMLDYAVPKSFKPTRSRLGVGQHPHRGFETVTLAYQGEVEHADSAGNRGVIGAGDIQWMTAGRGIIHEEFHSTNFAQSGGTFEMVQLWSTCPRSTR